MYKGHPATSGKLREVVQVWIEVGKETLHHKKGPHFRAEGQIRFYGNSIRAVSKASDLFVAINNVKDELQRELEGGRNKIVSKLKRSARTVKKDIKMSPKARFYRKGRIRQEGI